MYTTFNGLRHAFFILSLVWVGCCDTVNYPWSGHDEDATYFTNEFAVRVEGGMEVARGVALQHGYELKTQIGSLTDYYLLHHKETPARSRRETDSHHTKKLAGDKRVLWFEQQRAQRRVKRGIVDRVLRSVTFNDPLFDKEWYLNAEYGERATQPTMRIMPVWEQGITGRGVVVSVIDDGLEISHSDIARNYDARASWNFKEDRNDPTPPLKTYKNNGHGTRCAGEVAMVANNSKCGVGIAYNANIGGIRMLEGDITDAIEAGSLSHNLDHIDIFSASWGPTDDGKTSCVPGPLAMKALEEGVKRGRNGKGALYAWASGNGGSKDNCNCDGYSSSIYTIATSSVSETGQKTFYGEVCSSVLTTAYSSGSGRSIVSADLRDQCTVNHGGTSAAAPMTAGILALLLQASPELTWRDVQHIIVETSDSTPLRNARGVEWRQNAVGRLFSDHFGYGLLDAEAMVRLANPKTWTTVPEKSICTVEAEVKFNRMKITSSEPAKIDITTDGCKDTRDEVKYLEHVVLYVTIDYSKRGAVNVHLTSPSGTKTKLLSERRNDASTKGLTNFPLMSVQLWGEHAATSGGVWKLNVFDSSEDASHTGYLRDWKLELHGTTELPEYVSAKSTGWGSQF